jgi:prevent-host-death family protein
MRTTFSKSQARRRMRRLLALVAQGHTFVITKHGKAVCRLMDAEAEENTR